MKFLWTWMSKNPKFMQLSGTNPVSEFKLQEDDWKIEEIREINNDLISKFEAAKLQDPRDVNLLTSLGV